MNIVKTEIRTTTKNCYMADVLDGKETAFIGQCGQGPRGSLYLIAFGQVILASDPGKTWNGERCPITVNRFVDIEITVREK